MLAADRWAELEAIIMEETNRVDVIDPKEVIEIQNHPLLKSLVDPVENELKNYGENSVPLIHIRRMISSRHQLVHRDCRSVIDQRIFINELINFQCHPCYYFAHQLGQIKNMLIDLDVDRKNSKLKRIK